MIFFKNVRAVSWSAFRWLVGFYLVSLLVLGSWLRFYVQRKMDRSADWVPEFLNQMDQTLVIAFWILLLTFVLFSIGFIRNFFSPLDILIGKAKSIQKGRYSSKKGAVIKESRGEWYQLDLNLNKISKDLKRRKADVEKERGELEAVITAATDAVLAVDKDMNIRYYNAPMALFFDQKDEGIWGRKLREVIRNQNIIEAFQVVLTEMKSHRVQIVQDLNVDSTTHYYQLSLSPFFDEKKTKIRGAVAIFHDITEHKKTEKIRMDFVANASHELKTPLTSIQGYINYIKENSKDKTQLQEAFEVVDNNVHRLNRLISDLLELSKIESSELGALQEIDVTEFTENALASLKTSLQQKNHVLEFTTDIEFIQSNKDLLEHVFMNVVENSIKYCPPSSKIRIHWGESENQGGRPVKFLAVKDNGPGIESFHQGRLFERFYRVRDEHNQNIKGTGLGLSIVRNSMSKLGGTVDVKSAPGLGTEFICYFPQ